MSTDQNKHASLSGSNLPENTPRPSSEGKTDEGAAALPDDYDRTFGDWLEDDGYDAEFRESFPSPTDRNAEQALRAATALLTRQAETCAEIGLLPPGYYGEDCDFEEFFTPESVLDAALNDVSWGLLADPDGAPLVGCLAETITACIAEMQRAFDHRLPLSARLRMRIIKACRAELTLLHAELHAVAQKAVA